MKNMCYIGLILVLMTMLLSGTMLSVLSAPLAIATGEIGSEGPASVANSPAPHDQAVEKPVQHEALSTKFSHPTDVFANIPPICKLVGTFNSTRGVKLNFVDNGLEDVDNINKYVVTVSPIGTAANIETITIEKFTNGFTVKCSGSDTVTRFEAVVYYLTVCNDDEVWFIPFNPTITDQMEYGDPAIIERGSLADIAKYLEAKGIKGRVVLSENHTYPALSTCVISSYIEVEVHSGAMLTPWQFLHATKYQWKQSASTREYYLEGTGGGKPEINEPSSLSVNAASLTRVARSGSLKPGEWTWDISPEGFKTLFVRLPDSKNPDDKPTDRIAAGYSVTIGKLSSTVGLNQWIDASYGGSIAIGPGGVEAIHPEWWGAVPDGVTDSTTALQHAINASIKSKTPLLLLGGDYLISATLIADCDSSGSIYQYEALKLIGSGSNNTKIVSTTIGPALWVRGSIFEISGLTFRGAATNGTIGLKLGDDANHKAASQGSILNVKFLYFYKAIIIELAWDCDFTRVGCFSGISGGTAIEISQSEFDNSNNLAFTNCHLERIQGGVLFKSTGRNANTGINHSLIFTGCHFETNYYSTRTIELKLTADVTFIGCIFTQNNRFDEAESKRVAQIYFGDSYMINIFGGFINTKARQSKDSKLVQISGSTSGIVFENVYFTDFANNSSGLSIDGLIDASAAVDKDLSGLELRNIQFNDFKNVQLSTNTHVIGQTYRRFRQEADASGRLATYFGSFKQNTTGAWPTAPINVMGQYGSMSRGYPVTIPNTSHADFKIETDQSNSGAAIIAILADTPAATAGLYFKHGTSILTLSSLADFEESSTPSTGHFGISAPSNDTIRVYNNYGSDRSVTLFVMGAQ